MIKHIVLATALLAGALGIIAAPASAQTYGPPPPRYEPVPPPPRPGAVFEHGHYRWNGHRYVWVHGRYHWRSHARWIPGHYRGYHWVPGRWA